MTSKILNALIVFFPIGIYFKEENVKYFLFPQNLTSFLQFEGYFSSTKNWKHFQRLSERDYEFIFCDEGPLFISLNNQDFVVKTGDILIIPPSTKVTGFKRSLNPISFYWLHIIFNGNVQTLNSSTLEEYLSKYHSVLPPIILAQQIDHLLTANKYHELIIEIHQIINNDLYSIFKENKISHSIMILLLSLSELVLASHTQRKENPKISRLKKWIRLNLNANLSLNELANEVELNPEYLSRLFKKETGQSPKQYILRLKLQIASVLLIKSSMTVKEIAYKSHFSDYKLFMNQFKRFSGLTPTQYRKTYRKIHQNNPHFDELLGLSEDIQNDLIKID